MAGKHGEPMNFASDNWAGVSPEISAALGEAGAGVAPSYSGDSATARTVERFRELFETDLEAFFVGTGTAANSLALAAVARPGGAIMAFCDSHLAADECNATEFQTAGNKVVRLPGRLGRFSADTLAEALSLYPEGSVHHGRPVAVSVTQSTEIGTLYPLEEIRGIADLAHAHGLAVHMDGARFANAVAALGVTPAEASWKAGIDMMSFGATKNGCWCADAVLFFNTSLVGDFEHMRMRGGHLMSKSRFVAEQFLAYLADGHWLDLASRANRAAKRLADGIAASAFGRLAWPAEANEVFGVWTDAKSAELRAAGAVFYEWPFASARADAGPAEGENLLRLVTSFATTDEEVDAFLAVLNRS